MKILRNKKENGNNIKASSGQSLVEAMIAIAILTTGFLGIVGLLSRSLFLNRVVADETTANYLAAEGIEIAKNLIDHDYYESLPAPSGGGNPSFFWGLCFDQQGNPEGVELDYTTTDCRNDLNGLAPFANHPLKFDPVTDLYSYNPNPADHPITTSFTRNVIVTTLGGPPNEISVRSIVTWNGGSVIPQTIEVDDVFYNWQP